MNNETQWHLDKRVPIALILALAFQTTGVVWWAATMNSRVAVVEERLTAMSDQRDRIIRLEEKANYQTSILEEIKRAILSR